MMIDKYNFQHLTGISKSKTVNLCSLSSNMKTVT